MRLTQKRANDAGALGKTYHLADHLVHRLKLRVTKAGAKSWVIIYRALDGSQRSKSLGKHSNITLAMARALARSELTDLDKGIDPLTKKEAARREAKSKPFRELSAIIDAYRSSTHYLSKRPTTRATYDNSFDKHITPALGDTPIEEIKRADVSIFLDELSSRTTGNVSNHARSALSVVMAFALERDLIEFNPVQGVKRTHKTPIKERLLNDQTLKSLWRALDECIAVTPTVAEMIRLLMFIPARVSEVSGMAWSEIDFSRSVWTLPAERAKGGMSHQVPLGECSQEILSRLYDNQERVAASNWVFANTSNSGPMARTVPTRAVARIVEKSGLAKFSPHDFRHTCATRLAKLGTHRDVIERLLGHKVGTGRAIIHYDHYDYSDEKRNAIIAWERELLGVVGEGRSGQS